MKKICNSFFIIFSLLIFSCSNSNEIDSKKLKKIIDENDTKKIQNLDKELFEKILIENEPSIIYVYKNQKYDLLKKLFEKKVNIDIEDLNGNSFIFKIAEKFNLLESVIENYTNSNFLNKKHNDISLLYKIIINYEETKCISILQNINLNNLDLNLYNSSNVHIIEYLVYSKKYNILSLLVNKVNSFPTKILTSNQNDLLEELLLKSNLQSLKLLLKRKEYSIKKFFNNNFFIHLFENNNIESATFLLNQFKPNIFEEQINKINLTMHEKLEKSIIKKIISTYSYNPLVFITPNNNETIKNTYYESILKNYKMKNEKILSISTMIFQNLSNTDKQYNNYFIITNKDDVENKKEYLELIEIEKQITSYFIQNNKLLKNIKKNNDFNQFIKNENNDIILNLALFKCIEEDIHNINLINKIKNPFTTLYLQNKTNSNSVFLKAIEKNKKNLFEEFSKNQKIDLVKSSYILSNTTNFKNIPMYIISTGNLELLNIFLKYFDFKNFYISENQSYLKEAIETNNYNLITKILKLEKIYDINRKYNLNESKKEFNLLHIAVINNNFKLVKILINHKINVNDECLHNLQYKTALDLAIELNFERIKKFLISKGGKKTTRYDKIED